ncbi:hypothetical protein FS749_015485 [Ceratobasidium sp. UAMH 11750]|nr:hypothetical protein FS749_015485 [Ceratobasidium sp. UAMH 11750]
MNHVTSIDTTLGGTIRWMAPEQLRAETVVVSLQADIFSWGVLTLEDNAIIIKVGYKGSVRVDPSDIWCGARRCGHWCRAEDPLERPSAEELCRSLQ